MSKESAQLAKLIKDKFDKFCYNHKIILASTSENFDREDVIENWHSYVIRAMKMKLTYIPSPDSFCVQDPSDYHNKLFIEIDNELALKILTLDYIP